jgi:hypothetical protein
MKSLTRLTAGILFSIAIVFVADPADAQEGHKIVCKGGGRMHYAYQAASIIPPKGPQIIIQFNRGTSGVGRNLENLAALPPGHCAWLDRGVSPDEPGQLVVTDVSDFHIIWSVPGSSPNVPGHPYLTTLARGGTHSFMAYNNGLQNPATSLGALIVTQK